MIFLYGLFIGAFIGYMFGPKNKGGDPIVGFNMKIQLDKKRLLHIHHYVYCLGFAFYTGLISYILTKKIENPIILLIISFLIGISLNNLLYEDMLEFIKHNDICEKYQIKFGQGIV
jgi:hypothetical protein